MTSRISMVGATLFAMAIQAGAQATIAPGSAALTPARVRLGTDTIVLLVSQRDSGEHLSAVLIRTIARVDGPGGPLLRETQRYESHEPSRPGFSYDTLDVDARTLSVVRSVFRGGGVAHDVRMSGLQMDGTLTTPDSGTRAVHVAATEPFFHSMMAEAFVAAFPLGSQPSLAIPVINPPSPAVHAQKFDLARHETIQTAKGPVPCVLVTTANGNAQFWLAVSDGRLMRLHWMANGVSIWKLPQSDVNFRG